MTELEDIREAIRTEEFSMNRLAAEARVSHRTIGNLMESEWNPRLNTVTEIHAALRRLRAARLASGESAPEQGVA